MTIYAIGDIHGHLDLLKKLHDKIIADASEGEHTVVFVGDYVDRGPDSKGVIDYLISKPFVGFKHIFLKGNHEDMMLKAVESQDHYLWMYNGGNYTLSSYDEGDGTFKTKAFENHLKWLKNNLALYWDTGKYFFVHAGVDPRVPMDQQSEKTMLWIRDVFLNSDEDFEGRIVVHGHTPTKDPELKHNRINIDTGAFHYGVLTAVALEDNKTPRFIQAGVV